MINTDFQYRNALRMQRINSRGMDNMVCTVLMHCLQYEAGGVWIGICELTCTGFTVLNLLIEVLLFNFGAEYGDEEMI